MKQELFSVSLGKNLSECFVVLNARPEVRYEGNLPPTRNYIARPIKIALQACYM